MGKLRSGREFLAQAAYNTLNNKPGVKLSSPEIARKVQSGELQAVQKTYYIRSAQSTANNKVTILDDSVNFAAGVTNFINGKTKGGRVFAVLGIRIADGTNATLKETAFSPVLGQQGVKNGIITISGPGKEHYESPISVLSPTAANTDPEDAVYALETPFILEPNEATTIEIELAKALASNANIEVSLIGVEMVKR